MMKYLLLALFCFTGGILGCDTYERVPYHRPDAPSRRDTIVMLKTKTCIHCKRQEATLDKMSDELRGVQVESLSYENRDVRAEYPGVREFPTLYINGQEYTGYMSRQEILDALDGQ